MLPSPCPLLANSIPMSLSLIYFLFFFLSLFFHSFVFVKIYAVICFGVWGSTMMFTRLQCYLRMPLTGKLQFGHQSSCYQFISLLICLFALCHDLYNEISEFGGLWWCWHNCKVTYPMPLIDYIIPYQCPCHCVIDSIFFFMLIRLFCFCQDLYSEVLESGVCDDVYTISMLPIPCLLLVNFIKFYSDFWIHTM